MPAPQIYTVLTEFKFEVGNALVNSQKVQGAVDQISQSADNALNSLSALGLGFVANFGLGATGVLGILGQAVKASDNFYKSQLVFSNIISANMHNMTGDIETFNDRMMVSSKILKDIAKDSVTFGLPEQDHAAMTKMMSAILTPKGLAGQNFGEARGLSRNLLKSAPSLGVHPSEVQGQLIRLLESKGQADGGNTLFRRLTSETKVFMDKLGGAENAAKKFNALPLKERFQLVKEGMQQFANDVNVLAGNAQTLSSLFQRMRDMFVGFRGILVPLGNVIRGPIIRGFESLIKMLDNQGRRAIEGFSEVLKIFVNDLEQSAVGLLQAKRFSSDFKNASRVLLIGVLVEFLAYLGILGKVLGFILIPLGLFAKLLAFIAPAFGVMGKLLLFLGAAAIKFSMALLPILVIFQTISRAIAIARVNDLKAIPEMIAGISEQFKRMTTIFTMVFGPALSLMDFVAGKIAFLFQFSFYMEQIVTVFEFLNDVMVVTFGIIRGFIFAVSQWVTNLSQGKVWGMFEGVTKKFDEGVLDFFDEFLSKTKGDDGSTTVATNVTNIGKIEIQNQFKEQMEPDRIAFTLMDQMLKAATNPQQARGRSLRGMAVGN